MIQLLAKTLLVCLVLMGSQIAMGKNYLLDQAFLEDSSNSLTIDQVLSRQFTSYSGWLAKGYSPSTYWIKLTIRPSDQDLVLRVRPSYAESLEVFDPSNPSLNRSIGFKYAWNESDIPAYSHNLKLTPDSQERILYLKAKYARSYLLDFDVMPLSEFLSADYFDGIFYISSIVFIFALFLGLTALWLANREIVLGVFAIQQFIAFLHIFFLAGYARIFLDEYIHSSTINYFYYILVVVYPIVATLANKLLFEEYGIKRFFRYAINSLFVASLVVVSLLLFNQTGNALKLNAQVVMLIAFLFCLVSWFGTNAKSTSRDVNLSINLLRFYFSFNLVIWVFSILPLLGFVDAREFTAYSYLAYNMLSGLILFTLLLYRAKTTFKLQLLRSDALKREADNERYLREEQGRLMAMLTHEIRTPLSVLKLVVDRKVTGSELEGYANRAVSNIDSIIDKCIQLDQLDLNTFQIKKTSFNLSELIKSIVDDCEAPERSNIQCLPEIYMRSAADIIRIIVSNLVSNALKYSDHSATIDLCVKRISPDGGTSEVKLDVSNQVLNENIPDLSRMYDKFYRGPSSSKVSGSGLGLFLVSGLVDKLGGSIKCSIVNNQITFSVCIPD